MASFPVGASVRRENIFPRLLNARNAVRPCSTKLNRLADTMHAVPPHNVHCTSSRKPEPVMMPRCWRMGTNTAQHSVPLIKVLAHTRMPVIAPAATKTESHEKITVRPFHTSKLARSEEHTSELQARL